MPGRVGCTSGNEGNGEADLRYLSGDPLTDFAASGVEKVSESLCGDGERVTGRKLDWGSDRVADRRADPEGEDSQMRSTANEAAG